MDPNLLGGAARAAGRSATGARVGRASAAAHSTGDTIWFERLESLPNGNVLYRCWLSGTDAFPVELTLEEDARPELERRALLRAKAQAALARRPHGVMGALRRVVAALFRFRR